MLFVWMVTLESSKLELPDVVPNLGWRTPGLVCHKSNQSKSYLNGLHLSTANINTKHIFVILDLHQLVIFSAGRHGQAAIHDHANNIRTIGMGELVAVMNGVQFRTRHNDYRLNRASTTSSAYKADVEPIEFPPVPQSVRMMEETVIYP